MTSERTHETSQSGQVLSNRDASAKPAKNALPVRRDASISGSGRLTIGTLRVPVARDSFVFGLCCATELMSEPADPSTALLAAPQTLELGVLDLAVVSGPDSGKAQRIGPGRVRIGTSPKAEVSLSDPTVSRLHVEIDIGRHQFFVRDLESTNGTFIDAIRVFEVALSSATLLRIGNSVLRLELSNTAAFLELSRANQFGSMLGSSPVMRRVYAILERAALSDATLLIQGETGTGKEVAARAVHEASDRARAPFVAIDCGAIAENLMESELFGHTRGAFSGAVQDRAGLFEQAEGGTLFLDEIGELPLALQPKLLRALETREVRRVGSNVAKRIDVRVIAATNRSLARNVNEGTFREDLYYRLAVVEVELPPLRARREDIPVLARHFYRVFSGSDAELPRELLVTLLGRAWPGNVRELRNFIERSVALGWAERHAISAQRASDIPPGLEALVPVEQPLKEAREAWNKQFEILYTTAVLKRAQGNVTRAAELAGVTRRSLHRLIAAHGIGGAHQEASDVDPEAESEDR
jgi:DNA-binding NtrC family response regulator